MGETVTGNTTMLLEEGLDTGPILLQQALAIAPYETAADLFDVLSRGGAPLVVKTLVGLDDGSIEPMPQNHAGATFAPLLGREDGRMKFAAHTATELKNRWRGFQPWPGAFTALGGQKLIVHRMEIVSEPASPESYSAQSVSVAPDPAGTEPSESGPAALATTLPGQVVVEGGRLLVACAGNTWLELVEVQLEGKKRLPAADFLRGNPLPANVWLG
jgi:methionyl-tRNA formyltransferase